ncbi:homoserine acetyltransferase [Bradyrhizobium sp. LM6.9]
MTADRDYEIFEAGDVTLQSGAVVPLLQLAYKTYGRLSPAKDNVILYPTSFSAQHTDTEWLIGPDGVLDPTRYFIVIPNLFGNGLSSSPSNTAASFPMMTYHDAIAVQHRLLTERFGHLQACPGLWLVDGRHAGLPLGGAACRYGRARGCCLRQCPLRAL